MGFFDRAERERIIDKRMAEVEAEAQKRRAERLAAEQPVVEKVPEAAPEPVAESEPEEVPAAVVPEEPAPIPTTRLEDTPDGESGSYIKAPQDEVGAEVETKKTPEEEGRYGYLLGGKKIPIEDQHSNLAFVGPLFDYLGGSTLKESGLVKGAEESALAVGEDVAQTAAAIRTHLDTPKGTKHGRVASRVLSVNPVFQFVRGVSTAVDLGKGISDWARGKSEEAYGGEAQTVEASEEAEKGTASASASAYAYAHPDGTPIGSIAQGSESGEDGKPLKLSSTGLGGIDAISFGRGDPGGKSYGRHQFMTRMIKDKNGKLVRTGKYDPAKSGMAGFLQSKEVKPFSKEILASLKGADGKVSWDLLGSDKFDAAWTKVTTGDSRDDWGAAQSNYLGRTHLKPNIDYLNKKYKGNKDIALLLTNKGFLEAIYSGGIQYGATGARKRLIMPALAQAEKDNKLGDVGHVIELLYARRKITGHARPTEKKQVLEMSKS